MHCHRRYRFEIVIRTIGFFPVIAIVIASTASQADEWPQWRGPNRDGISQEKGLLQEWPTEGPKLLWHVKDLGDGYSTPAIADGRIFLINNNGMDDEYVQALSAKDGSPLWKVHLGKVGNPEQKPSYPSARSTPTVDGKTVYALGSDGDLFCLDVADGKVRWQKNLRTDFGGLPGVWAYSESPLVDGDTLVVTPGGKEATIIALNKENGEVIWKSALPEGDAAGYASVIIVNAAGIKQYVQFLGNGLVGVDAKTGKFLWRYDHTSKGSPANIATPTAADDCIYSATKYTGGGLVKLMPEGDGVKADEVYFERKLPKAIGGAVLLDGYLYGTGGELTQCVDFKTGEVKWTKERAVSPASILYADGRLYLHGEKEGDLALLEATPEGYKEHGHFTPPDVPSKRVGMAWEYPVVSDGKLYLHDWGTLWCYDIKADGNAKRAATRPAGVTTPTQR